MKIPPTGSPQQPYGSSSNPIVDKLNQLWNDWYQNPTRETGQKLLDFIQKNHDALAELAKNNPNPLPPPPQGPPDFEHSCDQAEKYLQGWLDHGCDPRAIAPPSEFIADMVSWVQYAE